MSRGPRQIIEPRSSTSISKIVIAIEVNIRHGRRSRIINFRIPLLIKSLKCGVDLYTFVLRNKSYTRRDAIGFMLKLFAAVIKKAQKDFNKI